MVFKVDCFVETSRQH